MRCPARPTGLLLLAFAACARAGAGSGPEASGDAGAPVAGDDAGLELACTTPSLGSPLLRLLTRAELDRTLSDIFPQVAGQWTDSLPSDTVSSFGFDNDSSNDVGNQRASALLDTALSVATAVTGTALATLLPCASTSPDRTCAEPFVVSYGRRLFRRPLSQVEHDRYMAFFDSSLSKSDFKTALKWTLAGLIQSPNAVYRREIGTNTGNGMRSLSPYELATELSYTYTGSTPTQDLLTKADSGNLGDMVAMARSVLATDPGKEQLHHFFDSYLGYSRVTAIQKPDIADFAGASVDMVQETRSFVDDVVFQKGGGLKELLTAPGTIPSQLAAYYGFAAAASSSSSSGSLLPIPRPSGRGIGILAQGSFLATHASSNSSSPTQRGLFVFSRLLCHDKPTPPPNVPQIGTPQPGKVTTRERYEQLHASAGACAACHKQWDPIGFGFEHYDEGGRYRQDEAGLPIDSSAAVPNPDGSVLLSFTGEEDLVKGLAAQSLSYQCFGEYMTTYAFGTKACLGSSQVAALQSGTMGIVDAFASLAAQPHFTQRASW